MILFQVSKMLITNLKLINKPMKSDLTLRKLKTNSPELCEKWKEFGLNSDEITNDLNVTHQQMIHSMVSDVVWNPISGMFSF